MDILLLNLEVVRFFILGKRHWTLYLIFLCLGKTYHYNWNVDYKSGGQGC